MDTTDGILIVHGLAVARSPVVLVSPHFGARIPSNFDAIVSKFNLRAGEDCVVDDLWCRAARPLNA